MIYIDPDLEARIESWNEDGTYTTQIPAAAYAAWAYSYSEAAATVEEFEAWASDAEDNYQGDYSDDKDFAQEFADSIGTIQLQQAWPYDHIDWDSAASNLMLDYFEVDGFYFRNA